MPSPEAESTRIDLSRESFGDRGLRPQSRSEASHLILLERLTDYRAIAGVTFQVRIADCRVDFYYPQFDVFHEYHPIKKYDWLSSAAYRLYGEHFRALSLKEKRRSWEAIKVEFAERYYRERRKLLNYNGHPNSGLIVTGSAEETYDRVFRGLFNVSVSRREFVKEWARLVASA